MIACSKTKFVGVISKEECTERAQNASLQLPGGECTIWNMNKGALYFSDVKWSNDHWPCVSPHPN
eukprot:8209338-Ditylum_brightwellii.AAC.1